MQPGAYVERLNIIVDVCSNEELLRQDVALEDVGVFDQFYIPFLNFFISEFNSMMLLFTDKFITYNSENILKDSLLSLKNELMQICTKTLIAELYDRKQIMGLSGENERERYISFTDYLKDKAIKKDIIIKSSIA